MDIEILHLLEGAKKAVGLTVIIDVFRAFSLACYATNNGSREILPVGDIQMAYHLKAENPGYILIGERHGRIQPGFDYGNSPSQISNINFTGKTIVHTTSAGTQGIANAGQASEIITGSLVNADAIVQYIRRKNSSKVSLVCMGNAGKERSDEDIVCAEYIKNALEGKPYPIQTAIEKLKSTAGKRFFNPANKDWSPESDFYLCTDLNRFNFVLRVEKTATGLSRLQRQTGLDLPNL